LFVIIWNVALALQSGFSLPELVRHWLVYAPPAVGRTVLFNSTSHRAGAVEQQFINPVGRTPGHTYCWCPGFINRVVQGGCPWLL